MSSKNRCRQTAQPTYPTTPLYRRGIHHARGTTEYDYDGLDNISHVYQSSQTRTFAHDWRGLLTSATNPESGTTTFQYDGQGNLTYRYDARGVGTTYSYDAMNRLHTITYSGGVATPNVTYTYDTISNGIGRLTSVATAATTMTISGQSYAVAATTQQILGYDPVGRVTGSQTTVGSTTLPAFSYTYNLADALLTETYPTGRTVSTCYDVAGRITGVSNGASTTCSSSPYLSAATYAPHGAPTAYQYGNSVYRAMSYNSHLQPYELQDTYPGSSGSNLLNLTYYFGGSTTLGQSNAQNNGSPTKIGISSAAGNFTQTYTYDHLKRLTQATDSSWSQGFSYDAYGNMWQSSGSALPTEPLMPTLQSSINAASNQFVSTFAGGIAYDSAGNLTQTGSGSTATTWTYDAESRQVLISPGAQYQYDGLGQRLLKTVNGNTTTYAYDIFGNLAVEYDPAGTTPLSCTTTCYVSTDHLGSARMVTDQGGTVKGLHDYLPFGTETNVGRSDPIVGAADGMNQKFTGQDRDSDSPQPQDHFPARYYTSGMGRFMSPDPAGNLIGDPANPQTWNLYSYALNNPLGNVDPTGLDSFTVGNCIYNTAYAYVDGEYQGSDTQFVGCFDPSSPQQPQTPPPSSPLPPPKKPTSLQINCTDLRIFSAMQGLTNLALASYKAAKFTGAVAAVGSTVAGLPAAGVLAIYGTASIFGQATAGAAELYSAVTGDFGTTAARVEQAGNILSGPASGLATLMAGGSIGAAERNASYESLATAGTGGLDALARGLGGEALVGLADWSNTSVGSKKPSPPACRPAH